ncbi:RluA family pseudouridine synthase [Parvularcula lutaonensis]|uniref:RluA family pseudouridine synthase n=1 Tax=Parvularcula lutaonensis TaxID=491923 RepID=A0ABV7MDV6_9PROT|nr:RluA family pseudouridine synthase [Parvularcula lutaonensis]GGY40675.1 RNA pseudouridine synthase [Parvularcula lutaonensis]
MPLPMKPYMPPLEPRLSLVHEDGALLVFDKPSGLLSVPGRTEPDCLEARVIERYPEALTVHRLDMATSGVIVMARSKEALAHLGKQFEKRQTRKRYIAVVEGAPDADSGTIDAPLRCDWPNRPLQMICEEHGRPAVTHWEVLERGEGRTRLALTPVTGRSHQLRVHLASIGHPILGDEWYGDATSAPRLLLHAERLELRHPNGGAWMSFEVRAPF